jgi:hypothetical protein
VENVVDTLNHPIAIIAILAGLAVFIREVSWFVRSIQGKSPTNELTRAVEKFAKAAEEQTITLIRVNDRTERIEKGIEKVEDKLDRMVLR